MNAHDSLFLSVFLEGGLMAGSYKHCVDDRDRFRGVDLLDHLDHLGDAYEALKEMYGMIWYLAFEHAQYAGDQHREAEAADLVEEARQNYKIGIQRSPGVKIRD